MSRIKSFTDDDDGAVSSASVELENVCDTPAVVKSDSELLRQARTIDEPAQPAYVLFLLSTFSVLLLRRTYAKRGGYCFLLFVCLPVRAKTEKLLIIIITALHGMQMRSSDENSVRLSVRPSVRPSVKRVNCDKTKE